jgi:hypothetical protein
MMAHLWAALMAIWLLALAFGGWWVWPHVERGMLTGELAGAAVWLVAGGAAWLVALRSGLQRYWPRRANPPSSSGTPSKVDARAWQRPDRA